MAIAKFGIPPEDAEGLVQDVFATFFMQAASVEQVERYLIGGICNAARKHLQRAGAADALFCGEDPCQATAGDVLLRQIERKQLLAKVLARIGSRCREMLCRYFVSGAGRASERRRHSTVPSCGPTEPLQAHFGSLRNDRRGNAGSGRRAAGRY